MMGRLGDRALTDAGAVIDAIGLTGTAFVQDEQGRVLLHRRRTEDPWALPGGARNTTETLGQVVMREVARQTGLNIQVVGVVGIYADPVPARLTVCLRGQPCGRAPNAATSQIRWAAPHDLGAVTIRDPERTRIRHGLEHRPDLFIDPHARELIAPLCERTPGL
jgi:ADP-ribose pyrophosphatase YjhB (NUDIX family)